jgi:hypothetical protein
MKVPLRHVNRVRKRLANGTVKFFYYDRLTGKRIEGEPGTLEFQTSYEASGKCGRVEKERYCAESSAKLSGHGMQVMIERHHPFGEGANHDQGRG